MQQPHTSTRATWFNSLLQMLGLRSRVERFTAEEVRTRLLGEPTSPRTEAVQSAAAHVGLWTALLHQDDAYLLGRGANLLPSVVFWYRQGVPLFEIGRRITPLGTVFDAERALEVSTALIAHLLNTGQLGVLRDERSVRNSGRS